MYQSCSVTTAEGLSGAGGGVGGDGGGGGGVGQALLLGPVRVGGTVHQLLQVRLPGPPPGKVLPGLLSPVAYSGEFTTNNGYFGPMGDRVSHPTACDSIFGVASNFYDLRYFLNNVRTELDNPFSDMMTMRFQRTRYKLRINGTSVGRKSNLTISTVLLSIFGLIFTNNS